MNTTALTKSIYVSFYRWNVKHFGYGGASKANSLFGVSFLMIVLLSMLLTIAQLFLNAGWFTLNTGTAMAMLLSATVALLLNYFVLLNSRYFRKLNVFFQKMSRHNPRTWSVMLMVCVIVSCGLLLFVCAANGIR